MGTGLKVLIPNQRSVSHLLKRDICGWYFDENEFMLKLEIAINQISKDKDYLNKRVDLAEFNSSFLSYDFIAKKMIDRLYEIE
jgi:hypothetical protein